MDVIHVLMCLKEEVAWATDKQPWVISNIMIVIALGNKNKVILNLN